MSLRPFYLPREFNHVLVTLVYVPGSGDYDYHSYVFIDEQETKSHNPINIVLGDLNQCDMVGHLGG